MTQRQVNVIVLGFHAGQAERSLFSIRESDGLLWEQFLSLMKIVALFRASPLSRDARGLYQEAFMRGIEAK